MALTVNELGAAGTADMTVILPRIQSLLAKVGSGQVDVNELRGDVATVLAKAVMPVLARVLKDDTIRGDLLQAQRKAVPHLYALRGKRLFVQIAGVEPLVFELRLAKPLLLYLAFVLRAGILLDRLPVSSRAFSWCVDRLYGPEEVMDQEPSAGRSLAARLAASDLASRLASLLIARVSRGSEEYVKREKIPGFWIDPEWLMDLIEDELPYRRGPQLMQKGVVFAMSAIEQGNSFRMKGLVQFIAWFGGWHEMWEFLANGAFFPMFTLFTSDTYRSLGAVLPRHLDPLLEKYGC